MDSAPADAGTLGSYHSTARRVSGVSVTLVVVLLVLLFLMADYSDVLFSNSRRQEAMELIKPGMRLTQAERELNGAGYLTLYIEETPPILQVSSLSRMPWTARVLHNVLPNSAPDTWLRGRLSGFTRFYVLADHNGVVKFTPEGKVATFSGPEILL